MSDNRTSICLAFDIVRISGVRISAFHCNHQFNNFQKFQMISSDAFDVDVCNDCGLLGYKGWCHNCRYTLTLHYKPNEWDFGQLSLGNQGLQNNSGSPIRNPILSWSSYHHLIQNLISSQLSDYDMILILIKTYQYLITQSKIII